MDTLAEQHPIHGQDATIKCRADADPPPEISWTKDDVGLGGEGTILCILAAELNFY